jgi:hypothetical protein
MKNETELAKKNMEISFEFSRFLLTHPELEDNIPEGALIIFQIDDDPELSRYNATLASRNRETSQPLVTVHIKGLAPTRLLEPTVTRVG